MLTKEEYMSIINEYIKTDCASGIYNLFSNALYKREKEIKQNEKIIKKLRNENYTLKKKLLKEQKEKNE